MTIVWNSQWLSSQRISVPLLHKKPFDTTGNEQYSTFFRKCGNVQKNITSKTN